MNKLVKLYVIAPIIGGLLGIGYNGWMISRQPHFILGLPLSYPLMMALIDFVFFYVVVAMANLISQLLFKEDK
jgi:hypothetical protein